MSELVDVFLCVNKDELQNMDNRILEEMKTNETLNEAPAVMVFNAFTESEYAQIAIPLEEFVTGNKQPTDRAGPVIAVEMPDPYPLIYVQVFPTFEEFKDYILARKATQATIDCYEKWRKARPDYTLGFRIGADNKHYSFKLGYSP